MSFTGTPLGQGRRLDHSTFHGKPPSTGTGPPLSYSAQTLAPRSPQKPSSSTRDRNHEQDENLDDTETALQRFARYKQRETATDFSSRPGGPKIITSPAKPDKWAIKDTSVNIANAFDQAVKATDMTSYNTNYSWASTSRTTAHVPRSTSVEYEQAAAAPVVSRRFAAAPHPPDKLGRSTALASPRKQPLKPTSSFLQVPDSEGEDESAGRTGRGRSPIDLAKEAVGGALGLASFYLKQRSSRPSVVGENDVSHSQNGVANESSYSYEAEEKIFQDRKNNAAHKRNRMSVDNKAYKPSQSDDEDDTSGSDDDKTKKRKKRAKKGPVGGPLTTLPVVGSDKKRRKKGQSSKGNFAEDGSESDVDAQDDMEENDSAQQIPITRNSNPPVSFESRTSHDELEDDEMADISAVQGLSSIPEIPEEEIAAVKSTSVARETSQRRRSRSRTPRAKTPAREVHSFSVGGLLGSLVHLVIQLSLKLVSGCLSLLSIVTYLLGQVFGTTLDILLRRPLSWLGRSVILFKYILPASIIFASWYTLQNVPVASYLPSLPIPSRWTPTYHSPDLPPANIAELSNRLLRIENALSGLSADSQRTNAKTEDGIKNYSDLLLRLGSLEGQLSAETKKVKDAEAKARETISQSISGVKQEVEILQSQILAQQRQREQGNAPTSIADEDTRAKLKALEERVGSVEGGVKEALDLGKKATSAPAVAAPAPIPAWWSKLASGSGTKSALQIRAADGTDVSALITHLVDSAVLRMNKDGGIAKPDFAMHMAGAQVIPSLTSASAHVNLNPSGFWSQLVGLASRRETFYTRPPVYALHHETHSGYCWPMAGDHGQLGVVLAAPVYVEEIGIDHIAKEVAFDMRSAPKNMEVWGMVEGKDNLERLHSWREAKAASGEEEIVPYPPTLPKKPEYIRVANFTYDINAPNNVQSFAVDPQIKSLGVDFGIVVLRVLDNWGNKAHTCLYRFRVHGQMIGDIPTPSTHVEQSL